MFGYRRIFLKHALTASMAATTMVIEVTPSGLGAQDLPPVPIVGDRIRVALPDTTVTGDVASISPQGFDVTLEDGGIVSVDLGEIFRLERNVATGSYWIEGAAGGFLLGALLQVDFEEHCFLGFCETTTRTPTVKEVAVAIGISLGGLAIGSTLDKGDEWELIWPQDREGRFNPIFDFGLDDLGQPVALLGGRIRH